mmetsp:Transcript_22350/g.79741  ORF Transcript_22350/g.79741 Transcript_22350/m.79741 type:complete len:339 (-) Transcript_22350:350-1366(-)
MWLVRLLAAAQLSLACRALSSPPVRGHAPTQPRARLAVPGSSPRSGRLSVTAAALHSDWGTLAALSSCAALGLVAEKRTKVGAAVSSNVVTMVLALLLVNVGVLPSKSALYSLLTTKLVALAVPMLLFDADLQRVRKDAEKLLPSFAVAAAGTVLGTFVAWLITPLRHGGVLVDKASIAAALAARHIGGAVNYVSLTAACQTPPALVAAGIAADNAVVAPYFALLFALSGAELSGAPTADDALSGAPTTGDAPTAAADKPDACGALDASAALALAACCVYTGSLAGASNLLLPLTTLAAVALASVLPTEAAAALAPAGRVMGTVAMQLFVAAVGASGE